MKFTARILLLLALSPSVYCQSTDIDWNIFRGKPDLSGHILTDLPSDPVLLWRVATGSRTKSSPVVNNGVIYFSNDKGSVVAIDINGRKKWQYDTGVAAEAPPLIYGDKIIAGFNDGILRALDKETGKLLWQFATNNQILGSANYWATGKRSGIIFGSYDYFLYSVDPVTGKLQWKLETLNYINGTPSVSGNNIVFGGCDGIIRIADANTGVEKSTIEIGTYIASSPALSGSKAFVGDYDGNFYCLDLQAGKILWEVPASDNSGAILGVPAISRSSVIIGNEDKSVYCYDLLSGKLKWSFRTNGRITGSAVVTLSKVIFGSLDGFVYMLNLEDGKKVWSFNTGAPIGSSPAVAGNRFFVLTEDGRLLAFGRK